MLRGKSVPCFTRWSEKGSATPSALTDVLREIDERETLDRRTGVELLILIDGRSSRAELEFVKRASTEPCAWAVFLGVPRGMRLWQVGDSSE